MDLFGKLDPYVIMSISNSRVIQKTSVIENDNTPVWNETFHFPVKDPSIETITFIIKDKDTGNADDPVSRLIIQLNSLKIGETIEKWYDLVPTPKVRTGGRIRLVLQLAPEGATPFA